MQTALARPGWVLGLSVAALVAPLAVVPSLGRTFLPEFNEGALTINVVTRPGTSLEASDRLGRRVETALLSFPEVVSTSRRTGRAELDEHAQDVNAAEIDVTLDLSKSERDKEEFLEALRGELATIGGANITVGQPLSHRIDHLLSGTRSAIAVKLFGDDLETLRAAAVRVEAITKTVPGAVDVSIEQQVDIPELEVRANRSALARFGLGAGELGEQVERALVGQTVGGLLEGQRPVDIVATGRSDYPNQVNNALCFPYLFRAALDVGAAQINEAMKAAAVRALADLARDDGDFGVNKLLPTLLDSRLLVAVSSRVAQAAVDSDNARNHHYEATAYRARLEQLARKLAAG